MVTTVKLQNPFEFSWWVILVTALFLAAALAIATYLIIKLIKSRPEKKKAQKPAPVRVMTPALLFAIKNQYLGKVMTLQKDYNAQKLDKREGYQKLSLLIRGFVHEVTGINVENYTKKEIKAMGIVKLDALMEEYYVPEFAEDEKARNKDFKVSCDRAMGVIRSWS